MIQIDHNLKRNPRALSMLGQSGAILGSELLSLAGFDAARYFLTTADYGKPSGASRFQRLYPENYINCGIAEQNMIGVAAGIASTGATSIAVAQACFLTMRGFEPIRQYCGYMELPIILIGVSSGFALQFFGNSHYALEDVSLMGLIPNMNIYTPSDAVSAIHCFHMAVISQQPSYVRCTGGVRLPVLYKSLNDISGAYAQHFCGIDVAVVSTGAVTANAINAVNELELFETVTVFDLFAHKALCENFFESLSQFKRVIVIEEHLTDSGIGAFVGNKIASYGKKVLQLKVPAYGHSVGTREFLLQQYGLDTVGLKEFIADVVRDCLIPCR